MTTLLRFLFRLGFLFPVLAARAGNAAGNLRVDVIVDMTADGKKIERPTPDKPAYYFGIYVGYKEMGDTLAQWHRAPPPTDEVKRAMTEALLAQGYRVATRLHPPSIALVFRWGSIATEVIEQTGARNYGFGPVGTRGSLDGGTTGVNQNEVLTIIAGDRWPDYQIEDPRQWETIKEGLINPRYFLLISALDFPAFTHHKQVLLWRAHVSTNYWGHYFDEALAPLITSAAPMLGRETTRPEIVSAPVTPIGRVIVGAPQVKDYPGAPPAP